MPVPDWLSSAPTLVAVGFVSLGVFLRVLALGVIPGNRKPSTGMAWLLLILASPIFGYVVFLFFGRTQVGRARHLRQLEVNRLVLQHAGDLGAVIAPDDLPDEIATVVRLNSRLGSFPLLGGNAVDLITDYRDSVAQMTAAVRQATTYVHAEFYIVAWDDVTAPFFEAMADAAARGVDARLLYDHIGSRRVPGYRDFLALLAGTGIEAHPMLPIQPLKGRFRRPDLRNHRKLLVVDGQVGFTGSQNLIEPGYRQPKNHRLGREWVELMVRVRGPLVSALDAVFSSDWYTETEEALAVRPVAGGAGGVPAQLLPSGPGFSTENNLRMFTTLIYSARQRISLTSPYFVPDESLLYAVTTAAQRGVDVELFVSELSDQFMVGHAQASYYRELLEAGVRIHLYPPPYILHSKHFTIDDDVAVVGSSNMDMRSFALNYEISTMLVEPDVVRRFREVEDTYRKLARELTLEEWLARPRRLKYVDNVMRLTAALQ